MTRLKTIEDRLQALPAKIAVPFRHLLQAKQLPEQALEVILDAGELSRQPHLMLGFAIAYLHLRSQGVPVHDVVIMAKARERKINLTWSTKRWKQEHERLSRMATLDRLVAANITYDLSKFEEHLPAHFPGYLIRSSRRLGMEGLRQRHCVASYHHKVMTRDCAIAAVFVEGLRWTVEMVVTGRETDPILIAQIKSRYNESPCRRVRDAIHDLLGVAVRAPAKRLEPEGGHGRQYMGLLQCVLPVLREHGVGEINVAFDGSGDSGMIEHIGCLPDDREGILSIMMEHPTIQRTFEDGQWISRMEPIQQSVRKALEELTYDYLEDTDVNWYDNEGGFGELRIDVVQGTVQLEVNARYTEVSTEFNQEHDIATGLEIG